jgi:SAM-dependent methyltransferase
MRILVLTLMMSFLSHSAFGADEKKCDCSGMTKSARSVGPEGGRASAEKKICAYCNQGFEKILTCSRCGDRHYCSRKCQKDDWKSHKKTCHNDKMITQKSTSLSNLLSYFDTPELKSIARNILSSVFESRKREILGQTKYGQRFPINPEVLAWLMRECRDKKVLEIAGASGENSILMALAGARSVHLNDITELEVEQCVKTISKIPEEYREKITAQCGNLFALPDEFFEPTFDLIYARNIFHFMKKSQHVDFFDLIKKLLKPGGKLLLTVNSNQVMNTSERILADNFCFKKQTLILDVMEAGQLKPQYIFQDICISEMEDDPDPINYQNIIYDLNGQLISGLESEADFISPNITLKMQELLRQGSVIPRGSHLRILTNNSMMFSTTKLSAILTENGFEVTQTFLLNNLGHRIISEEESDQAVLMQVVAILPVGETS